MKKLIALVLVALLALSAAAFAENLNTDITVGFCPMDLSNNFFAAIANSMKDYAGEKGVTAVIKDGKSDAATQVAALEDFIAQEVDVIVVVPVDAESLKGVIAEAKEAGIPVITHTTHYDDATINMNLSEHDMGYANGSNCGKWMAETFGPDADCKFAILTQRSLEQTIGRENGIVDGIAEYVPGAECVITVDANTTDMGITAAENILSAHPEVVAILGINDSGALGAYETCIAQEVGDQFYIGGNDGTDEALKLIKGNTIYRGSVDINPKGTGVQMIDFAIDLANGIECPTDFDIPVYAISIENVDTYME